jgi:Fic family protein
MTWNWQQKTWPEFEWDAVTLQAMENHFLHQSGIFLGAFSHFSEVEREELTVEIISNEAMQSARIEGEMLNRDSLQLSIRRNFGLSTDARRVPPAEKGMANLMTDLYRNYAAPLNHESLFDWHEKLMLGRRDLHDVGCYRTGEEPMQVVSGSIHNPKIHFEAPPATMLAQEMDTFIRWFNDSAPDGSIPLPLLTRAGITHLYFVSIHPFEDGNGRIARALAEKALSQGLKQPVLLALSQVIESGKKTYYEQLERNNRHNWITSWLNYFAETAIAANARSQSLIEFLLAKTRLYDRLHGKLNERQQKVFARMFREGPDGFKGGLSAENYIRIADTSRATATRDLQKLLEIGALTRTGERKSTRYWLNLS